MSKAHIYTPKENTLAARVGAYRLVLEAYKQAQASLSYDADRLTLDRLGEPQEIEEGFQIARNSLEKATKDIKQSELDQARIAGYLDEHEVREFHIFKSKLMMEKGREPSKSRDFGLPN